MAIPTPAPRIARFESLGYGMFIHWGLYAQVGQGEWVQHLRKIPLLAGLSRAQLEAVRRRLQALALGLALLAATALGACGGKTAEAPPPKFAEIDGE